LQAGGGGAGAKTGLYAVPIEPFCVQGSVEGRSDSAGPGGKGWKQGESFTLNTADRHSVTAWAAEETGTLQARTHKGLNHENVRDGQAVVQTYGVRRLTPVECERLQAFPDGWTEPAGSDSARYKAMGNAVTVNTVRWILGRMLEQS